MSTSLTMVTRAVAIAVRVSCDLATDVGDINAYAHQVGKRIQGTYGAELRRMADSDPEAGAQDLYEAVILPAEFPWLAVENPHAAELSAAADRDRTRRASPNEDPPAPLTDEDAARQPANLTQVRAGLREPGPREPASAPEPEPDPEYSAQFGVLRAGLDRGRERGAEDRKVRRDRANQAKESA